MVGVIHGHPENSTANTLAAAMASVRVALTSSWSIVRTHPVISPGADYMRAG